MSPTNSTLSHRASPCVPPLDNVSQWQTLSLRDDWQIPEPPELDATVNTTGRENQDRLKRFYWGLRELPTADGVRPVRRVHKRLLTELAYQTRVHSERDCTYVKQAELARKLKCSLRTISRRMHDLGDMGLLLNEQQYYHQGNLTWLRWHPLMAEAGLKQRLPQRATEIPVEVGQDRTSYDKARQDTPKNGVKCLDSKDLQAPITIELLNKETDAARAPHPVENLISNELLSEINSALESANLEPFPNRGEETLRRMVRQAGNRVDLLPRWIAYETRRPRTTPVMVTRYLGDPDVLKRMDGWLDAPKDPPKPRAKRTSSYPSPSAQPTQAPFSLEEVREFLTGALDRTPEPVREELVTILSDLPAHYANLEPLEQQLCKLEDAMLAMARAQQSEADLAEAKRQLDSQLRLYRGKMSTPQLVTLEKQFLDRWLLEKLNLPRLSLFYLHH